MRYIVAAVFTAVIATIVTVQLLNSAGGGTVLFEDNFNRADSLTLGDPWVEGDEGDSYDVITAPRWYLGPGYLEIVDQAYGYHFNKHPTCEGDINCLTAHPYSYASAPLIEPLTGLPATISSTIQNHRGERIGQMMGLMSQETDFIDIPTEVGEHHQPVQGVGVILFRGASNFSNSRMDIVRFEAESDERIVLAQSPLPFQIEDSFVYSWSLTIGSDYRVTAVIQSPQGTHSVTTPDPVPLDYIVDQLMIVTTSVGAGRGDYEPDPYIIKLDDLVVVQTGEDMCGEDGETRPLFCPPFEETNQILHLPLIINCERELPLFECRRE